MMFILRKILSALVMPISASMLLAGVGLVLLRKSRRRRDGDTDAPDVLTNKADKPDQTARLDNSSKDDFAPKAYKPDKAKTLPTTGNSDNGGNTTKTKKNKLRLLGTAAVAAGFILLYIASNPLFSTAFIRPLEQHYQAPSEQDLPDAPLVVVLGAGMSDDPEVSPTSNISSVGIARIAEALRIYQLRPEAKLLFTAGDVGYRRPLADAMGAAAESMGVPRESIIRLPKGRNTATEAAAVAHYLEANGTAARKVRSPERTAAAAETSQKDDTGPRPDPSLILVSSASHLPRAMLLFRRQDLEPIPAPADYEGLSRGTFKPADLLPSASALYTTERAWHEYLGIGVGGLPVY